MTDSLKSDSKRRLWVLEFSRRIEFFENKLDEMENLIREAQKELPPVMLEKETKDAATHREYGIRNMDRLELLIDQEICRIVLRAFDLDEYGVKMASEDIKFLQTYSYHLDAKQAVRVEKYFIALLQHPKIEVRKIAQENLNMQ